MHRRRFVTLAAGACLLEPFEVRSQAAKASRIGLLHAFAEPTPLTQAGVEALRAGLRELGWIEGKNLAIESRYAGLSTQRQRDAAAELKALPVALIVALGTAPIAAARDGAPDLPIVMVNAGDPVGAGLVVSLSRPGGNLTGTSAAGEEILAKQVEMLSAALPQLRRAHVLMSRSNPAGSFFFDAMTARARALRLDLHRVDVGAEDELDDAIGGARGGALMVVPDPLFYLHRERITALAIRNRVPSMYGGRDYVTAGGLMSYLSSSRWHWRSAAGFIDKILKGARPADLPVQQPTQFELVVNLGTARALGLTLPRSFLRRADELIG